MPILPQLLETIRNNEEITSGVLLRTLSITRDHSIEPEDAIRLFDAISMNTTLWMLSIKESNLGSEGVNELACALIRNTSLYSLELNKIDLGAEGAILIANALRRNSTLNSLELNEVYLGPDGVTAFANTLRKNSSLEYLTLDNVGLESGGSIELANVLRKNSTLVILNLDRNKLGPGDTAAFEEALEHNYTLFNLRGISSEKIQQYLKRNKVIHRCLYHCLHFYDNDAWTDVKTISEQIKKLEDFYPEGEVASYVAEIHRLLSAIGYFSSGEPLSVLQRLKTSFQDPRLACIADRLLGEVLVDAVGEILIKGTVSIDNITQKQVYQLQAYHTRNQPSSKDFAIGILGMSKPEGEVVYVNEVLTGLQKSQKLPNGATWISYEELQTFAKSTLERIAPNCTEALLLNECIQHKDFSPITVNALFKSPEFIQTLVEAYRSAASFQCLETYLDFQHTEGLTEPYTVSTLLDRCHSAPIDEATIVRYQRTLELAKKPGFAEELEATKSSLVSALTSAPKPKGPK